MRNMLRCMLIPFLCLLGLFCSLQAQDAPILKIAALHPVLGDMARSIGGSRVQVADLLRPNGNLHSFEPAPQDIAAAGQASLVLASGKNLEPYLPKLKDALGGNVQILDLEPPFRTFPWRKTPQTMTMNTTETAAPTAPTTPTGGTPRPI